MPWPKQSVKCPQQEWFKQEWYIGMVEFGGVRATHIALTPFNYSAAAMFL